MTFCKNLKNAVSFRIPGDSNTLTFNPCCLYDNFYPFHPLLYQRKRKKFIEAETFLPGCSKCELKERTHNISLRTTSNKFIPDGIGDSVWKLEIVLDTTCNAACIQCGTFQSSLWRKEYTDHKKIYHIQPEQQIDEKIKQIREVIDINQVKTFHFWGGEPLLTDTHLKFIREIENPKDVILEYTTNCSIFPDDEILKLWENFKEVQLALSIDGIEDKFHYIRWPLRWSKIERNLTLFRDSISANTRVNINCCILPLNVLYVNELGSYLKTNYSQTIHGRPILYNFIRGEGTMDIAATPLALREKVWETLPKNHDISNVLREVPIIDYGEMLTFINFWDSVRKLNWKKTFPEIVKYFEN